MENRKILLGLTTTPKSDWKSKIEEIKKYNIEEIALFPTYLGPEERKELYALLEDSPVKSIPHVHLRDDMELWELDHLVEKYGTQAFNIHPGASKHPTLKDYAKYTSRIFVENLNILPEEEELKKYGGLCIDFSHWEGVNLKKELDYDKKMKSLLADNSIGCSHVSAVRDKLYKNPFVSGLLTYTSHWLDDLQELVYVKKYKAYLPELISIELENPFGEQLKAKEYLEKIINEE